MNYYILTLFPDMIEKGLNHSIIKRAIENKIININCINIRDFATNKHKQVDDYVYGGGAGMVIKPEPIYNSYLSIKDKVKKNTKVLYMTPQGKPFNQKIAKNLSKEKDLIILCGHYEGIDERVIEEIVTDEISIGDFILTGGELPAMILIDSISRLLPNVLNKKESFLEESFSNNLLEYPVYTRPFIFNNKEVPSILLSGNHKKIQNWKLQQSLIRTYNKRPDLLNMLEKEGDIMLDVCLLGTGGMMPLPNRFLTSMLFRLNGKMLLIDCGEGTQVTAKMLGWGFKNIDIICFTHLHADHIAGLPGLLLTIGNSNREETLTILGPIGLKKVYEGLSTIFPEIPFKVNIIELNIDENNTISDEINIGGFNIQAMFMEHKVPCFSYKIEVKRMGKFLPQKAINLNIPCQFWGMLQKGENVKYNGQNFTSNMVLGEERKGIKICYCTDSRPLERMYNFLNNADLFVCEGLYGEEEKKERAIAKKHMIFSEAAIMAKYGNVKELWLTHFSPALIKPEDFRQNATNIFENTIVGYDRMFKTFYFEN